MVTEAFLNHESALGVASELSRVEEAKATQLDDLSGRIGECRRRIRLCGLLNAVRSEIGYQVGSNT